MVLFQKTPKVINKQSQMDK